MASESYRVLSRIHFTPFFAALALCLLLPATAPANGIQVNIDVMGNDILGDAANEPSIAVDPNDPNRIPVLMVHGLWSSPRTWMDMFNDLRSFPEIRERYQFWFYLYPSVQPFWIRLKDERGSRRQPPAVSRMARPRRALVTRFAQFAGRPTTTVAPAGIARTTLWVSRRIHRGKQRRGTATIRTPAPTRRPPPPRKMGLLRCRRRNSMMP